MTSGEIRHRRAAKAPQIDGKAAALLAGTTAINILLVLVLPHFPYGDTANHIARYRLISASWRGSAPAWIHFHWIPTAYIALDIVGAAVSFVLGPTIARICIAALCVIVLPLGAYRLFTAVSPDEAPWSLVTSVLAFNWYFLTGFLSYSIGVGAALLWLAWWWPRRNTPTAATLLIGALGVGLLYMVHMSSAATVACVLGVWCLEPLVRSQPDFRSVAAVLRRGGVVATYMAIAAALHLLMKFSSSFPPPASDAIVFRDAADKLRHLGTPFASFSSVEAVLLGGAYTLTLFAKLSLSDTTRLRSIWAGSSLLLLLAYFVFPLVAFGAWDVDVRFLLPALIVAFLIAPVKPSYKPRAALAAPILAGVALAHAAMVLAYSVGIERRISDLLQLAARVPPHSRILVLDASENDFFRIDPFTHAGEWLLATDPQARVNGLFAGGPNGAYLAHFIVDGLPYDPGVHWQRKGFPPLPWGRIDRDYSFILLEGNDSAADDRVRAGAASVASLGAATLFRVRDSGAKSVDNRADRSIE